MDNISDVVTSYISFPSTPRTTILKDTYSLGFGVTMWFSMLFTLQNLDFLPVVAEQWWPQQRRKLIFFVRKQIIVSRLLRLWTDNNDLHLILLLL